MKSVTVSILSTSICHKMMGTDAVIFIASWLSQEALQTAEKIREVKGKEERERYTNECTVPEKSRER